MAIPPPMPRRRPPVPVDLRPLGWVLHGVDQLPQAIIDAYLGAFQPRRVARLLEPPPSAVAAAAAAAAPPRPTRRPPPPFSPTESPAE